MGALRAVARVWILVPVEGRILGVGVVLFDPRPSLGLLGILDVVDAVDVANGYNRLGREHDLGALLDVDNNPLTFFMVVALDPDRDGRHDVEERTAIIGGGLVEDREPFATLIVNDLGPHAVVGRFLLPPGRQFGLLEQWIVVDLLTELEADIGQSLIDVELVDVDAVDFGRQNLAVDELTLAGRFHLGNHVGWIASATLSVHGTDQMQGRIHCSGIPRAKLHVKYLSVMG